MKKKTWMQRLFRFSESSERQSVSFNVVPLGSSGTESYAGYPSEDYLNQMRGTERADLFDKMRRSDPQIKMCLSAVSAPIKSATWEVEPACEEEMPDRAVAEADADLVRTVLMGGMEKTWNQFIQEALTVIPFGHSVFEVIDKPVLNHQRLGSFNGLRDIAFRSQRTIERWNLDSLTGGLKSVSQYASGDLDRTVDIPSNFLVVFSLDREGSNYEGISALRPCYGNYFRKNQYLKLNAIGIEKFAIPTPLVKVPQGLESGEQFNNMTSALESYLAHEKGYLTYPEGWEVDLKTNVYDPQKVEISIDNEDKRMVKAFLANFLELGLNGFGSQSLSFDLSDFFLGSIQYIAKGVIAETLDQSVVRRIIVMNRGERPAYPKLKVSGIDDKLGQEFGAMIKGWTDAGLLRADDVLESHLRKRFGMPAIDSTTIRQPKPQAGFGASPSLATPTLAERVRQARASRLIHG